MNQPKTQDKAWNNQNMPRVLPGTLQPPVNPSTHPSTPPLYDALGVGKALLKNGQNMAKAVKLTPEITINTNIEGNYNMMA